MKNQSIRNASKGLHCPYLIRVKRANDAHIYFSQAAVCKTQLSTPALGQRDEPFRVTSGKMFLKLVTGLEVLTERLIDVLCTRVI
jgi:hypothetical protein